jgi:L-2-hydroxyglutarate oxidase LhgO
MGGGVSTQRGFHVPFESEVLHINSNGGGVVVENTCGEGTPVFRNVNASFVVHAVVAEVISQTNTLTRFSSLI